MEPKKVNITLTKEQYELLFKGLYDVQISLQRRIEEIVSMGGVAPTLEKHARAFYKLSQEIEQQTETQLYSLQQPTSGVAVSATTTTAGIKS